LLPRVYPIVDTASLERIEMDPADFAEALLEGGARILQFRHKGDYTRAAWDSASRIAGLCANAQAGFIVNDRADVALMLDAGVHVGQQDLRPADARSVLGPARWIGYSTHNEAQLLAGGGEPVHYLAFGPVFETRSKEQPDPTVGIAALARLRTLTSKPLVAIGGITLETAAEVLAAGADSVAIIGGFVPATPDRADVRERMEEWLRATKL